MRKCERGGTAGEQGGCCVSSPRDNADSHSEGKGGGGDAEGQGGQGSSGLSPDAGQRRSGGGNKHADHALVRTARIMLG